MAEGYGDGSVIVICKRCKAKNRISLRLGAKVIPIPDDGDRQAGKEPEKSLLTRGK